MAANLNVPSPYGNQSPPPNSTEDTTTDAANPPLNQQQRITTSTALILYKTTVTPNRFWSPWQQTPWEEVPPDEAHLNNSDQIPSVPPNTPCTHTHYFVVELRRQTNANGDVIERTQRVSKKWCEYAYPTDWNCGEQTEEAATSSYYLLQSGIGPTNASGP